MSDAGNFNNYDFENGIDSELTPNQKQDAMDAFSKTYNIINHFDDYARKVQEILHR